MVHGPAELWAQVEWILAEYRQPALVEEFIGGIEYTIGVVGDCVLPVLGLDLTAIPGRPAVRDPHVKERDTPFIGTLSFDADPDRYRAFAQTAVRAHAALEALDCNRMDFRTRDGRLYFLEANVIPGIHPATSDLPTMARRAGVSHAGLIAMILYEAVCRYARDPAYTARFSRAREELGGLVADHTAHFKMLDEITWRNRTYVFVGEQCGTAR